MLLSAGIDRDFLFTLESNLTRHIKNNHCIILTEELFLFLCCQVLKHLPEGHDGWMEVVVFSIINSVLFGNTDVDFTIELTG